MATPVDRIYTNFHKTCSLRIEQNGDGSKISNLKSNKLWLMIYVLFSDVCFSLWTKSAWLLKQNWVYILKCIKKTCVIIFSLKWYHQYKPRNPLVCQLFRTYNFFWKSILYFIFWWAIFHNHSSPCILQVGWLHVCLSSSKSWLQLSSKDVVTFYGEFGAPSRYLLRWLLCSKNIPRSCKILSES